MSTRPALLLLHPRITESSELSPPRSAVRSPYEPSPPSLDVPEAVILIAHTAHNASESEKSPRAYLAISGYLHGLLRQMQLISGYFHGSTGQMRNSGSYPWLAPPNASDSESYSWLRPNTADFGISPWLNGPNAVDFGLSPWLNGPNATDSECFP